MPKPSTTIWRRWKTSVRLCLPSCLALTPAAAVFNLSTRTEVAATEAKLAAYAAEHSESIVANRVRGRGEVERARGCSATGAPQVLPATCSRCVTRGVAARHPTWQAQELCRPLSLPLRRLQTAPPSPSRRWCVSQRSGIRTALTAALQLPTAAVVPQPLPRQPLPPPESPAEARAREQAAASAGGFTPGALVPSRSLPTSHLSWQRSCARGPFMMHSQLSRCDGRRRPQSFARLDAS